MRCRMGSISRCCALSCSALSQQQQRQRQRQQQKCVERGEESSVLGSSCLAVHWTGRDALLQAAEQSWLPFKGRTAWPLTPAFPAARQRKSRYCTSVCSCAPQCLEVPRPRGLIRGAGRGIVAGTYSAAVWWPGFYPLGPRRDEQGLLSPSFRTSGEQDEGSWPVHPFSAVLSAWPRCLFIL